MEIFAVHARSVCAVHAHATGQMSPKQYLIVVVIIVIVVFAVVVDKLWSKYNFFKFGTDKQTVDGGVYRVATKNTLRRDR